jgi:hypothetical protein
VADEVCETRVYLKEYLERLQSNKLQSIESSEFQEEELTTSQTAHAVPLPPIHISSLPTDDTISWTIGQEEDKNENTPNKSFLETIVQENVGYIRTKVKKGEQCDHLSETHLKKEVLGVPPTLQDQFKEKHDTTMFEPLDEKDSILRISRRQILDESENPFKLPDSIKLSYPHNLKRKDLATFTGSCKAIFQGGLPLKKKDPGSFNSIGKLSVKEAQCSPGEGINFTPTWVIGKFESILAQPSYVDLTLAEESIKNLDGVVNDVVVQEERPSSNFVTSEI